MLGEVFMCSPVLGSWLRSSCQVLLLRIEMVITGRSPDHKRGNFPQGKAGERLLKSMF